MDELKSIIEKLISERAVMIDKVLPYSDAGKLQIIRQYGQLLKEEYRDNGIYVMGTIPKELANNFE